MKIIAIDYGKKHIGVAFSDSPLAEPLYSFNTDYFESELQKIINFYNPELILLGSPDPKPTPKTLSIFSKIKATGVSTEIIDETLSSHDARMSMMHKSRKSRKNDEHKVAAAIMLQHWLDSN